MTRQLRWGIIGVGGIAARFAAALPHSRTGVLAAVASRSADKAGAFARQFDSVRPYGSYAALLEDRDVDAVYIATPHPQHEEWAVRAAEAGKHVLCEKPLAMNEAEARRIVDAARRSGVFLMEAFMYRCHPQTRRLCDLLREGAIGEVRVIRATFGFRAAYDLERRWLNRELGGGAILDVGCYPVSMTRLIAGVARGAPFADPVEMKGSGRIGPESRCDEWACAVLKFPGDIVAQCSAALQVNQPSEVVAYGTAGFLVVPSPWFGPGREGGTSELIVHREGSDPQTIKVEAGWLYAIEADTVADHLEAKEAPSPAMGWEDSIGNMRTLDQWRAEIGMSYDTDCASA